MISGPEAHRIGRALESLAGWAAEVILVLNQEVTDGTDAIAVRHGAKVFREPWRGFIGQKNSAAAKATQPWLLNLDADEVVTPELAAEIAATIGTPSAPHAAYEFPRCTLYCGRWIRHGDWYPDRVLRLWRSGSARWAGEEPHARLAVNGSIGRLKSDLHHFTNDNIAAHIRKIIPYSDDFVRENAGKELATGFAGLAFRPFWRFFRAYFLRLGFLDGWQGYYIAWVSAFSVLTKYARLLEPPASSDATVSQKPQRPGTP
jgi:glycosyltransferase involved in cell wall biosynthesis